MYGFTEWVADTLEVDKYITVQGSSIVAAIIAGGAGGAIAIGSALPWGSCA